MPANVCETIFAPVLVAKSVAAFAAAPFPPDHKAIDPFEPAIGDVPHNNPIPYPIIDPTVSPIIAH